jgi:hypothetical protein
MRRFGSLVLDPDLVLAIRCFPVSKKADILLTSGDTLRDVPLADAEALAIFFQCDRSGDQSA